METQGVRAACAASSRRKNTHDPPFVDGRGAQPGLAFSAFIPPGFNPLLMHWACSGPNGLAYMIRNGDPSRMHVALIGKKTGKNKTIALKKQAIAALPLYFPQRRGDFSFVNNRKNACAISRAQAWRILHAAAVAVEIAGKIACGSLRKT